MEEVSKYYHTGKPCKRGHLAARLISTKACIECIPFLRKRWRAANLQAHRDHNLKYAKKNPEKVAARWRAWRDKNSEHWKAWLKENRKAERIAAKRSADAARRRASRRQACPSWISRKELDLIYREARAETKRTGVLHHVDHIVPLVHDLVCGLHVPWNLQVLVATENLKKSNRHQT